MILGVLAGVALSSALADAELPRLDGAAATPIGGILQVGGVRLRMGYLVTSLGVAEVAERFLTAWDGQGLPTTADGDFEVEAVVSAFHTREGLQRSAIARAHGGGTLVLVVVRDLWAEAAAPAGAPPDALEVRQGQARSMLAVVDGGPSAARQRVEAQALARGLTEVSRTLSGGGVVLEHVSGSDRVISVIAPAGAARSWIWQIEGSAR